MSLFIAILGLAFLILVHEAGHFFASLAVGLRPRRFYVGFPPAIAKTTRKGIEYGIGAIPLGGFVTIPGMHRPIPHDAERRFSRAVEEAPALGGAVDRVKRSLEGDDLTLAEHAVDDFEEALKSQTISPAALASAEKGITELRDALGADAYWKAPTWKRLVAIGAGPAANIALTIVLFTFLFMTVAGQATRTVAEVAPELEVVDTASGETLVVESPAKADRLAGGRPDRRDQRAARAGGRDRGHHRGVRRRRADAHRRSQGRRGRAWTDRRPARGRSLPARLRARRGAGSGSSRRSVRRSRSRASWRRRSSSRSVGSITGEGRDEVSSPIGITQASSDAVERGADSYLWVLGLISLSLALLNLLPLLPLDGGHILFTLIEGARGRFLKREIYERVSMVGLAVVLLLFFVGLSNDIGKLS